MTVCLNRVGGYTPDHMCGRPATRFFHSGYYDAPKFKVYRATCEDCSPEYVRNGWVEVLYEEFVVHEILES